MQQQTLMRVVPPLPPHISVPLTSSIIQQSLTDEAAEIIASASADAAKRHHSHISPLHVFVALLSARNSYLRRTCTYLQSQKTPSLIPTCRALDLCFSVALDRLPALPSSSPSSSSPPFANSLIAALKRAQAIQRRGSPDHPLISVRVDHLHLIVSILDDPSVSRVMREAGFSSVAVKDLLLPSSSYVNPRLVQGQEIATAIGRYREEIQRVVAVFSRTVKRNPVLVGDSGVDFVMEDLLGLIKRGELGSLYLVSLSQSISQREKTQMVDEIRKAGSVVSSQLLCFEGAVLDLGDLKWFVESKESEDGPSNGDRSKEMIKESHRMMIETAQMVIAEVAVILKRHPGRVWVMGTATCATYLRCQVYHPSMESEWDLKALPITPRSLVGVSPSFGGKGVLSSSVEALNTSKSLVSNLNTSAILPNRSLEIDVPSTRPPGVCNSCLQNYNQEILGEIKKISPYFGHLVHLSYMWNHLQEDDKVVLSRTIKEANEKWQDTCKRLHCYIDFVSESDIDTRRVTDLSLGLPAYSAPTYDSDSLIKLSKGLVNKVGWQLDAAMSVASIVMQIKSGTKKRYASIGSKFDTWLLFAGPDMNGKRKMACTLSKLFFSEEPIIIDIGPRRESTRDESNIVLRGKTVVDRVVDAVRSNPLCVIVLEGIDQANNVVQPMIKRAIETGRLTDSNGREVVLGSSIFVLIPESEEKENILDLANLNWHLRLTVKKRKRRVCWGSEFERKEKCKKNAPHVSLDLNLAIGLSDEEDNDDQEGGKEGSSDSSDVTMEHGHALGRLVEKSPNLPDLTNLFKLVDQVVEFKPVDLSMAKLAVSEMILKRFASIIGDKALIDIEPGVLNKMAHAIWYSDAHTSLTSEWAEKVLVPAFLQLKCDSSFEDGDRMQLSVVKGHVSSRIISSSGSPFPISLVVTAGDA